MGLGLSLLSIVIAVGFEWFGRKVQPKGGGAPGGGGGGGRPAVVMVQHWFTLALYVISGMAWAVTFWPLVRHIGWTWLVVGGVIIALGLGIGTAFDIWKDKKPDGAAFITARAMPLLLLIATLHWATFTGAVGHTFNQYGDNLNTASFK